MEKEIDALLNEICEQIFELDKDLYQLEIRLHTNTQILNQTYKICGRELTAYEVEGVRHKLSEFLNHIRYNEM